MAFNVPLSSLIGNDGNVTYTQTAVLRVGSGSNITVAAGLFESGGLVGVNTAVSTGNALAVRGNVVVFGSGTSVGGNIFVGNITTGNINTLSGTNANITLDPDGRGNVIISAHTQVLVQNTAPSTTNTGGALIVAGGVGISGNVYASNAFITSNVGIGSTDLVNSIMRIYGNNTTDVVRIRQDGIGNALVVSDGASDATPFLIDGSGNVGVGTATAFAKIHIGNTTSSAAHMIFDTGTLVATQRAGAMEYDGITWYQTDNITGGRGVVPHTHQFRLNSARPAVGSPTVVAYYFGPSGNVGVLAGSTYEFEYHLFFTKTTNGTVTFTLNNAAAPVNLNATMYVSNATSGGGTASTLDSATLFNSTAAAAALPVTKTLTTALNYYAQVRGQVDTNATTGGNLAIYYTASAGTVTPLRGSWYKVTRLPTGNVGVFT